MLPNILSGSDAETSEQTPSRRSDDSAVERFADRLGMLLLVATALRWLEQRLSPYIYTSAVYLFQFGIAFIFLWFGAIKFVVPPPITAQFTEAIWFLPPSFPFFIGYWEVVIGLCFVQRGTIRWGVYQLVPHQIATFLPIFVMPDVAFVSFPFLPEFAALYICKNFCIIAGGLVLWYEVAGTKPFGAPPTGAD